MRLRTLFFFLCLAPLALAEGLPDLGEVAQADFSPAMEKHVGATIMRDIRLHEPSYVFDPEISAYLNQLGSRLVAQSTEARQDFEFFVLRDATLNAFAMPGGFIGVHTGLIMAAQSESELASVLAHEISHVTQHHLARQLGVQSQASLPMLLSLAVAILASRSHSGGDVAQGALMAGQAAGIQNQLNYSRDFEREADRLGIQLLERAGFDISAMAAFFERLQKFGRLYENNAPGYLRTHPLTSERIADMENRIHELPYRQVPDTLEFLLVRAKLKASDGTPQDAVKEFGAQLRERKFTSEIATRYGLALAQSRAGNFVAAERELVELRRLKANSAMIESLAADLRMNQKDLAGALKILRQALARYPHERGLAYALVDTLLAAGQPQEALKASADDLLAYPSDDYMRGLQAKTYSALGMRFQQHRAQAEAYVLQGLLLEAINQLQFAQKDSDGDFYEHSQVDARLRELKLRQATEAQQRKQEKQER
ncbi:MAG: M48 family metalloprotease [Sterolibacterium sp.]|nr:M48 family metalloprotease [Sterolibacterium sp.]